MTPAFLYSTTRWHWMPIFHLLKFEDQYYCPHGICGTKLLGLELGRDFTCLLPQPHSQGIFTFTSRARTPEGPGQESCAAVLAGS